MGKRIKNKKAFSLRAWILKHSDGLVVTGIYIFLLLIILLEGQPK